MPEDAAARLGGTYRPIRKDPHAPAPPNAAQPVVYSAAGFKRPRLLVTSEELAGLRKRLDGKVEKDFFACLIDNANEVVAKAKVPPPGTPIQGRGFCGGHAECALAFRLTDDQKYLDTAKKLLLGMSRCDPAGGRDPLSNGHNVGEIAWTYDWIAEFLKDGERQEVVAFVRHYGGLSFNYVNAPLGYWVNTPMHNITICNWSGQGTAGLGFHDEFDEAKVWADCAQRAFRAIAWMTPPDGGGIEGPQYSAYGYERKTQYYEAARRVTEEDLYVQAEARAGQWFKHLSKPTMVPRDNAFCWNDNGPYFDAHGPVYSLLALARRFKCSKTQAVALKMWRCNVGSRRGFNWTNILMYDPTVPEADWNDDATAALFEDLDMVGARSSWKDDATAVSFSCGPYQGHRAERVYAGDPGGSHHHADAAAFQVCSRGEDLIVDPGYEYIKYTSNHNTVLVNGLGQLGEGIKWYNVNRVLHFNGTAEILSYVDDGKATAWVGAAHEMYVPEAKLTRFHRHVLYLRPDLVVVLDDLAAAERSVFTQLWHSHAPWTEMDAGAWGFAQERAALALLPAPVARNGEAYVETSADYGLLKDMTKHKEKSYGTLRVESPLAENWIFLTVIGIGDAKAGAPKIEVQAKLPDVKIVAGPGAGATVRFDLEQATPPALV